MAGNKNLSAAKNAKKDEFYTQLDDITNELEHYKEHFKGKKVLCNCDDPYESNFFRYFALKFNELGLKQLIATCYDGSPVGGTDMVLFEFAGMYEGAPVEKIEKTRVPHKIIINEVKDFNNDGATDLKDIIISLERNEKNTLTRLKGNGDFRSPECMELLKDVDIIVTNPPFSLFREYVAALMKYEKKFLIVGNQNAITYKEIFPLIKENKIWLGYGFKGNVAHFTTPYEDVATASDHREGMIRVSGVHWFTNLEHKKRHEPIDLYKLYTPEEYPRYDNYDAIEVSKTSDIPMDYDGVMGVPITFLDKYCPEQFEIIKFRKGNDEKDLSINGNCPYFRILIRKRK